MGRRQQRPRRQSADRAHEKKDTWAAWNSPSPSPSPSPEVSRIEQEPTDGGTAIGDAIDMADLTRKDTPGETDASPSESEAPPALPGGRRKSSGEGLEEESTAKSVKKSGSSSRKKRERVKLTEKDEEVAEAPPGTDPKEAERLK